MSTLNHSDNDYHQHNDAIHLIAEQYHINETLVRELYENVLESLQVSARCKQFLSILATRHVKEQIVKNRMEHQ